MYQKAKLPRLLAAFGAALLLAAAVCLPFAVADMETIPVADQARNPLVRVLLRRLQITDRFDLTLESVYALQTETGLETILPGGSELSVQLTEGALYLYLNGLAMKAGDDLRLIRQADASAEEIGFRRTNYPALYQGDLRLTAEDGAIRPILTIAVEDYLLGVTPYEMSDYFPLEALKAQTVAARTYALRKQGSHEDYDVVDTTNDQVFKGYVSGFANAERAVRETVGVCGFYQGELAQCYYAASNGGRTELPETVWPGGSKTPYYASVEDPYDVENPASSVKRTEIRRNYSNEGSDIAPYGLRRLLAETFAGELTSLGFDPTPGSVRVLRTEELELIREGDEPVALRMKVCLSARTKTEIVPPTDPDQTEVELFLGDETAASSTTSSPLPPVETLAPSASPRPVYGPFVEIEEPFECSVSIFPTAEKLLGMDLSSNYENELWSLTETEDGYLLEARRYGHGAGMSQRGAEWMAARYQKTYQEILRFYYPGMELARYSYTAVELPEVPEPLARTPGPAPTPTPRPTPAPVSLTPEEGQRMATVTGVAEDSSLNLRSAPDLSGEILTRLYRGQRLLVEEQCPEEGWVKVRMDGADGYVMESYLTYDD